MWFVDKSYLKIYFQVGFSNKAQGCEALKGFKSVYLCFCFISISLL